MADFTTGTGHRPSPAYTFCAQAAEVEVDRATGEVKVLQMTAAHDCGYAINPMAADGQVEGSIMSAMGQAMFENLEREEGRTLQSSFLEYRVERVDMVSAALDACVKVRVRKVN